MAPFAFPVGQCANCEQDNRLLKYCRRTMCCKYACQRAAHAEVQARKASRGGGEVKEKAPPVFCFSIIEVYGQRDVDPASLVGAKRRNPLAAGEKNESYLVYGEFAESETDAGFKDVRWVELTDLLNIEDGTLSKIDEYEKKLYKRMSAKRKALIETQSRDRTARIPLSLTPFGVCCAALNRNRLMTIFSECEVPIELIEVPILSTRGV